MWTTMQWSNEMESVHNQGIYDRLHDFDRIITDCDLARLSFFMRSAEAAKIKMWMKKAWTRVTLSLPSSLDSLADGEFCVICYAEGALEVASEYGSDSYYSLTPQETFDCLKHRLADMSHDPSEAWIRVWQHSATLVRALGEIES